MTLVGFKAGHLKYADFSISYELHLNAFSFQRKTCSPNYQPVDFHFQLTQWFIRNGRAAVPQSRVPLSSQHRGQLI